MKKQDWQKNKKSTASLRKILFMLSKDLPALADDLIGTWEGAANFANDVAESIIRSKPLRVPLNTGRCEDFQKYEALGERGWVYLLPPYDFDMLAYHSPLMDHLDEVMEMRLRALASKYDAAWAKIYAVIGCRFPSLIAECNEVERHRVELHNIVADLYLGERPVKATEAREMAQKLFNSKARGERAYKFLKDNLEGFGLKSLLTGNNNSRYYGTEEALENRLVGEPQKLDRFASKSR